MKGIKIQILLSIALLCQAILMQGMALSKGKHVRFTPRPVITQPMQQQPTYDIKVQPTTQTWKDWFQSLFTTKTSKPVEMYTEEVRISPFGPSGQRRSYSSEASQNPGFFNWVK